MVVQDWGGPIGLRWAVENADRVDRLVIMNTGLFTGRVSKGFMAWRDFAERNPDLPVGFIIQGATATDLPDDVVAAYEAPFPNPESKAGAAAVPVARADSRRTPPVRPRCWRCPTRSRAGRSRRSWRSPTPIPSFPTRRPAKCYSDLIPGAGEQVPIEGAAHFLQEDRGEQIAEHVLRFVRA